jgi:uncharacterized membrane protein YfcA
VEAFSIYLPIAEMQVNLSILALIGLLAGVTYGTFGFGGGIVLVPAMIAVGISPDIAVGTAINAAVTGSVSSYLAYVKRKKVDYQMAMPMIFGAMLGVSCGVWFFDTLSDAGQVNTFVSITFLILLGILSTIMFRDAVRSILSHDLETAVVKGAPKSRLKQVWRSIHLPFANKFESSQEPVSYISVFLAGVLGGAVMTIMGIGGGLILAPIMLYVMRIDPRYIPGTLSLYLVFSTIMATGLHAVSSHNVDLALSSIMMIGSAFGAQIGVMIGSKIKPSRYKLLLSLLMMAGCIKFGCDLFLEPSNRYEKESLPLTKEFLKERGVWK